MNISTIYQEALTAQPLFVLLLLLPVVATIVGVAKHVIGVKSLGIYAPIVLTFAFYFLGLNGTYGNYSDIWTGVRYGLIFLLVVIVGTVLSTRLLKNRRMHYFPKVSFVLSTVSIFLFITMLAAQALEKSGFTSINAFALILIASVAEQFTAILFKKSLKTALLLSLETSLISIFCYLLIAWPSFQQLIVNYPFLILLTLVVNYLVGKYRGLRVRELLRFQEILDESGEN